MSSPRLAFLFAAMVLMGCLGDSDQDGLSNARERRLGTDPHQADTDGDRLSDGDEVVFGTLPLVYDTDADGYADGDEVDEGSNPRDARDRIYAGGWPYYHDKDALQDLGFEGPVGLNFPIARLVGIDGFGQEVDLYDYAGQGVPTLIESCSLQISRCNIMASWRHDREPHREAYSYWNAVRRAVQDGRLQWVSVIHTGAEGGGR